MKTSFILLLFITFLFLAFGQENDKVTADPTTDNPTSSLEKGVEGLVKIVHGFLNTVQSEDFISQTQREGKITFSEVESLIKKGDYAEFANRWRDLVAVFGGFTACVVIGFIFILCMPLAACINCCCFCCCKKCGKASSRTDPKTAKCQRFTYGSILFLLAVLLLVGAIFAVISNEILHSKLDNVNEQGPVGQMKTSLDSLVGFASVTAGDIVTESIKTVNSTVAALIKIIVDASANIVTNIQDTINAASLLDQVDSIGRYANTSAESLKDVQEEVDRLKRLQNSTKIALSQVKNNLEKICNGTSCPDLSVLSLTLDFSGLNDLENVKTKVDEATGIETEAAKARAEFDRMKNEIQGKLNSTVDEAETQAQRVQADILKEIPKINSTVNDMTKNLNVTDTLKDGDDALKNYGDYVWYAFIGIPCLMILVVVFYFLGLLFGTCGERPGHGAPCCNKGAGSNILCCGVICSYLFSSILMLIVIIMFIPFGLLYTNGCRYLNDGVENIEKFEFIVNDTLGFNLQKYIDPDHKSNTTETIGIILRNCKNNSGIYSAFHLENLFDIDTILDMTKITSEINKIVAEGSTVSLTNITIIPSGLKEQLDKFAKSGIADINFTQYDEVLTAPLVTNLSSLIQQLDTSQNQTTNDTVKNRLDEEKGKLKRIQNHDLALMSSSRNNLSEALNNLRNQNTLEKLVENLTNSLNESQERFNSDSASILNKSLVKIQDDLLKEVERQIGDIKSFIKTVGPCKPIYTSVQMLSDAVCVTFLDRVNSIWFGLGWGLAFYIPCIIFALCTASLYQREIPYDSFHKTRTVKKKKNKEESQFDNPDIDSYQGQGYDAYGGAQGDNIPLTGMGRGGNHNRGRGDGVHNDGYYSPDRRSGGYPDYRRSGYPDDMDSGYRGGGGYHDRGSGYSSPPPYNGHDDYPRHSSANKYRQY